MKMGRVLTYDAFEFNLDSLPASIARAGSRMSGALFVFIALIWGCIPLFPLLAAERTFRPTEVFIMLAIPVAAVVLLLWGVREWRYRKVIEIGAERVSVAERGLFRTTSWQEPLSGYRGVKAHSRIVRQHRYSYVLYVVDLVHPDGGKSITLYASRSEAGLRRKWEYYARRLGLPAVEEDDGGLIERKAEDFDKPAGELVEEGKLAIDYRALGRRARGLAADIEGDTVVITRTGPESSPVTWAAAAVIPGVLDYFALTNDGTTPGGTALIGGLGVLLTLLIAAGFAWDMVRRRRLRLSPRDVRVSSITPWGETEGRALPAEAVEAVRIACDTKQRTDAVVISSDDRSLAFGHRLPEASLEFVRSAVLAKLAENREAPDAAPVGRHARALLDSPASRAP